ncbi:MAG: FtsX-like permease family protein [Methylococcales bacterium]
MVNSAQLTLLASSRRFFIKHPWQLWLTLLSIALGSAVMIAVDVANHSAKQSFALSVDQIAGSATHYLSNRTAKGIDEQLYVRLRLEWDVRNSAPMVDGELVINGLQYTVLGIDPLASRFLQPENTDKLANQNWLQLLSQPNTIFISKFAAQQLQLEIGSALQVSINQLPQTLQISGIHSDDQQSAYDNLILTDIATAQELLDKPGRLDRIALTLNSQQAQQLTALLPDSIQLQPSSARSNALDQMTAAFRINLTAMSLLAMLVGCFLVYNTMTFSVLQRRQQFAIERMLGVTGKQIFWQILIEAMLMAVLGSVLGIVMGVIISKSLLALVTRTINEVFAELSTTLWLIEPMLLFKGVALTIVAVLLATLAPALEAANIAPTSVHRASDLEQRNQQLMPILMLSGFLLIAVSFVVLGLFSRHLVAGFSALFLLVIGYSLIIPSTIKFLLHLLNQSIALQSTIWKLAVRGISSSLSRTNLAITALAIAVSATVGVGIMTQSFRTTLADWLEITLQNDLYISSTNADGSKVQGTLDASWLKQVRQLPGIVSISTGKASRLQINDQSIALLILDPGKLTDKGFNLLAGDTDQQWQSYLNGKVVLISEPYAYHQQLSVGDHFQAFNDEGKQLNLEVGAIFQDYSSSQGMIVVHRNLYNQFWRDDSISSIGLLFDQQVDAEQLKKQLSDMAASGKQAVRIRYNKEIREQSLTIFDRTFAITNVLRLLVVMVAFVGVFSALMALLLEKQRDYAVLRATGLTPRQLAQLLLIQTALTGSLAGLLAIPLGWIMSELLIHVINQRSFGWSMNSIFPLSVIAQAILLSVLAAVLAALYPIHYLTNMSLRQGLSDR